MASIFFDSSALVKRYVRENGTSWVRSLTRVGAAHTLTIAHITAVEVVAAITRRQHGGTLSASQAGAILNRFRRQLGVRYAIREITPPLLSDAMRLARSHRLRAYDADQLAAVLEVDLDRRSNRGDPVTLVSPDRDFNAAAAAEGLAVEDPNLPP